MRVVVRKWGGYDASVGTHANGGGMSLNTNLVGREWILNFPLQWIVGGDGDKNFMRMREYSRRSILRIREPPNCYP